MTLARTIAKTLLGNVPPSPLMTDAYKLSMAQAGFPLRQETFYLSFRSASAWRVPFDLKAVLEGLLPTTGSEEEIVFLDRFGYSPTAAMRAALTGSVQIEAAPTGSWVLGREPFLTVTGPSFLVSWLEPMAIWLHYPIQVATAVQAGQRQLVATCDDEATIARTTAAAVGCELDVEVRSEQYAANVRTAAERLVAAVRGDADRLFEVGMRSATCMAQHLLALKSCRAAGINRTSNVYGAAILDMTPVGTAGHEHLQRWGDDWTGFRALRDTRPSPPSYLLDTYDVYRLGLPAARDVMTEDPARPCAVRFDSGDQDRQLRAALDLFADLQPAFIFEDSYDAERTFRNEAFAANLGIDPARRLYGYGGHLVARTSFTELTRDHVSAVWKLAQSGSNAVMKHSTDGKESAPGRPVVFRRLQQSTSQPLGLIGQVGEVPPIGYDTLLAIDPSSKATDPSSLAHECYMSEGDSLTVASSDATGRLITNLRVARDQRIAAAPALSVRR